MQNNLRARQPVKLTASPLNVEALRGQPNATRQLLKPLLDLAKNSDHLIAGSVGKFVIQKNVFQIPRFIFMGPTGGGDTIRLGIFAGLHVDDPEGSEALVEFLKELESTPQMARGCHIYVYPVCNPAGFAASTRGNVAGENLTGHFWRGSAKPEVYYLEREMGVLKFHGVISLQTRKDAAGFHIDTKSEVLNPALAQPALQATRRFLPGNMTKNEPNTGLVQGAPQAALPDFLTVTEELNPLPFELHIGIPKHAPKPSQIHGTVGALRSILDSYRNLLSIGQNL